ncbi:cation:dicarboxylate symporter family transporter, partial [Acinetobacter baumannii]|uniref:cation:dicarboxylate symporter family transporter n=1 Tax=Acinetobacter baumannii TaxID=470 RepID=UPI000AF16B18
SHQVQTDISHYKHITEEVQSQCHGLIQTMLSLIPTNIISSMAHGEMLPVIFLAVLLSIGLSSFPATTKDPFLNVFHAVSDTMI